MTSEVLAAAVAVDKGLHFNSKLGFQFLKDNTKRERVEEKKRVLSEKRERERGPEEDLR